MRSAKQSVPTSLATVICASCFILGAADVLGRGEVSLKYDVETSSIILEGDRRINVRDESMAYVIDWSSDYSRGPGEGRILRKETLVFSGYINHSRRIFYAYNLTVGSLIVVKNVTKIALSDVHGWAVIQAAPLYSSAHEEGRAALVVNGVEFGSFLGNNVESIKWADGGGLQVAFRTEPTSQPNQVDEPKPQTTQANQSTVKTSVPNK